MSTLPTILHVITGLNDGGAEAVLFRLCTSDTTNRHIIISLMGGGKYGPLLQNAGVTVHCLGMPQGRVTLNGFWRLVRLTQAISPELIQTWMYHANLLGSIAGWIGGGRSICWGIRHTNLDPRDSKSPTILIAHLSAFLSHVLPQRIIYCSRRAADVHQALGYDASKGIVIPNGYGLDIFRPDRSARLRLRNTLEIKATPPLLGMVARFNPQKDHTSLLIALGSLKQSGIEFQCLLVGPDVNEQNRQLLSTIQSQNLEDRIRLLGPRNDIPDIMNAIDLHILSSSSGEAFPNVLAEAMACGTPCVTTDVGDASLIVGDTGWVVPPRDPDALSKAIHSAITNMRDKERWTERKNACRVRIVDNFSLERMVEAYSSAWQSVLTTPLNTP